MRNLEYVLPMIGILLSIGLAISYIEAAWNGFDAGFQFLPAMGSAGLLLVVGVLLFPRTIGMALTPIAMLTPVAFAIALIRVGLANAFAVLSIGLGAIVVAFLIGSLRPDSTGNY